MPRCAVSAATVNRGIAAPEVLLALDD